MRARTVLHIQLVKIKLKFVFWYWIAYISFMCNEIPAFFLRALPGTTMQNMTSFEAVFERLLFVTKAKTDSALARTLNIKPQSVVAARKRRQIPPGWLVTVAQEFNVTTDWLFFGTGPMRTAPVPPEAPYELNTATAASRDTATSLTYPKLKELEEKLQEMESRNRELERQLAEAKDEALKAYRLAIEAMRPPVDAVQVPPPSPYGQPVSQVSQSVAEKREK